MCKVEEGGRLTDVSTHHEPSHLAVSMLLILGSALTDINDGRNERQARRSRCQPKGPGISLLRLQVHAEFIFSADAKHHNCNSYHQDCKKRAVTVRTNIILDINGSNTFKVVLLSTAENFFFNYWADLCRRCMYLRGYNTHDCNTCKEQQ